MLLKSAKIESMLMNVCKCLPILNRMLADFPLKFRQLLTDCSYILHIFKDLSISSCTCSQYFIVASVCSCVLCLYFLKIFISQTAAGGACAGKLRCRPSVAAPERREGNPYDCPLSCWTQAVLGMIAWVTPG